MALAAPFVFAYDEGWTIVWLNPLIILMGSCVSMMLSIAIFSQWKTDFDELLMWIFQAGFLLWLTVFIAAH
jgi:hypothetical protein